jgi:hypothetical protein
MQKQVIAMSGGKKLSRNEMKKVQGGERYWPSPEVWVCDGSFSCYQNSYECYSTCDSVCWLIAMPCA